jgi:hypothetical protein
MVLGNAGFFILVMAETGSNEKNRQDFDPKKSELWYKYVCFAMNMIHCSLGLLCSFITVGHLRINIKESDTHNPKVRGSNTILIMNIPYVISLIIGFLMMQRNIRINFDLINHYLIPIFTSAFNTCLIVQRKTVTLVSVWPVLRNAIGARFRIIHSCCC